MKKETAAQRIERIKLEKDGLSVLKDIHEYAQGLKDIDPEDIDRFKWYGLYTQNKNLQDTNDENLYFMLRLKIEHGSVTIEQLRCISKISKEFGRDTADFTTRQTIQIHFIHVSALPEIFKRLKSAGLSSIYAAGDVPRNIATCPVAGIDHDELIDTRVLAQKINDYFRANKTLVNLPRKYKVGISGCSKHCIGHEIQDLSFSAVNFDDEIFFDVHIGGGLGSNKQISKHFGYVKEKDVLFVTQVVTEIYRDHGLRENRRKARLGHLLDAWGTDKLKALIEDKLGFSFVKKSISKYTPYVRREHFGIHPSLQKGKSYVGCAVNGGNIGADGLAFIADTLEKCSASTIKITNTQNFVVKDVDSDKTKTLVQSFKAFGIEAFPSPFKARTISCTGIRFCKFAITETKNQAIELASYLEGKFPDFDENISISLNGCPNSCAHPHIVDIGLLGIKLKNKEGNTVPGFELIIGGNLEGEVSEFGTKTGIKIEPEKVNETVEKLIYAYQKTDFKAFRNFLMQCRENNEVIETILL